MRCYESSMASRDEIASLAERIDLSLELSRYTHVIHINRFIVCFVFVWKRSERIFMSANSLHFVASFFFNSLQCVVLPFVACTILSAYKHLYHTFASFMLLQINKIEYICRTHIKCLTLNIIMCHIESYHNLISTFIYCCILVLCEDNKKNNSEYHSAWVGVRNRKNKQ